MKTDTYQFYLLVKIQRQINQSVDIDKLTSMCSGLAYILLADNKNVTWKLDAFLGATHNCFDGAIRIYWPKFKVSDNRFSHPLWTSDKIENINQRPGGFESYIFNILCDHSSSRFVHEALTWEGANRVFRKIEIEELKKAGNKDEWIDLLEDENADLTARVNGFENENDALRQENFQLKSQVNQFKYQLNEKDTTGNLSEELEEFESVHANYKSL
ncbi:MAG: bZIP transcription factor [Balneolaceae bacterium]|nr:bZIP transcription factor [Balneolaceae bacterium]